MTLHLSPVTGYIHSRYVEVGGGAGRAAGRDTVGGEPPKGVSEAYGEGAGGGTRIRGNLEWRHTEGGEPPSGVSEAYGEGAGGGTRIRGNLEWRHTVKVCASASVGQRGKALLRRETSFSQFR